MMASCHGEWQPRAASTCWREKNQRNLEHTHGAGEVAMRVPLRDGRGGGRGLGGNMPSVIRQPAGPVVLAVLAVFSDGLGSLLLQPFPPTPPAGSSWDCSWQQPQVFSDHTLKTATGSNLRPPPARPQKEGFMTANCPQRRLYFSQTVLLARLRCPLVPLQVMPGASSIPPP